MVIMTLLGLIEVRANQARRVRGVSAGCGRFPVKRSVRLSEDLYKAVHSIFDVLAPDLSFTDSEMLRILIEYAAIWAPLRERVKKDV